MGINLKLKKYNFRGKDELYSVPFNEDGRPKEAAEWFRANPHRLHLGIIGFELSEKTDLPKITNIHQSLQLWSGTIVGHFLLNGQTVSVETNCHPKQDLISAHISSSTHTGIKFHFPYPSGVHTDDACNWKANDKHSTTIVSQDNNSAVLLRTIDATTYYVSIRWEGKATLIEKEKNYFVLHLITDR